jgi:hypothetical protein
LDSWQPFDKTVPELLKLTSLPNTIERFIHEETGATFSHPTIHRTQDKRPHHPKKPGTQNDARTTVDKYCHYCGTHGHLSTNCDFMAKLLIAQDSLTKVDTKVRKDLQDNFREEQRKKRDKKLKKKTGMIRQLLDTGGSREEIDAILASIPDQEDTQLSPDDESTASTSRSDE